LQKSANEPHFYSDFVLPIKTSQMLANKPLICSED